MAVQVLSLGAGLVPISPGTSSTIYPLTGSPALTTLTTIIKSIRLANRDSVSRAVNLYINTVADGHDRRISPSNMMIPPGGVAIDDQEITMTPGDVIRADANSVSGAVIDFYISGIQR